MLGSLVLGILALSAVLRGCQAAVIEDKLVTDLLTNYNKIARPATETSPLVKVNHGMSLIRIESVKGDIGTVFTYLSLIWNDTRLVWNPRDYYDLTTVYIPTSLLWMPDIVQYNSLSWEAGGSWQNLQAAISHEGELTLAAPFRLSTNCGVSEDGQVLYCTFTFGSWVYNGWKLDVDNRDKDVDLSDFISSYDWELKNSTFRRQVTHYTCCPEPFITLSYQIKIERKHHRHDCN